MQNGTFSPNETPDRPHPPADTGTGVEESELPISPIYPTSRATSMSAIDPALHPVTPERRRIPHMSPELEDTVATDADDMPIARRDIFAQDVISGSSPESPSDHLVRHTSIEGQNVLRHQRRGKFPDYLSMVSLNIGLAQPLLIHILPLQPRQLLSSHPHLRVCGQLNGTRNMGLCKGQCEATCHIVSS